MKIIDIATETDIEKLNTLIAKVNADKTHCHEYYQLSVEDFDEIEKKIIFVTRYCNQITGFLSLHCRNSFQNDNEGTFEVFAHPDFKGKGYGSALIDRAEQYVIKESNIKNLKIAVLNNNPRAKKLYIRKGFISLSKDHKGEWFFKKIKD